MAHPVKAEAILHHITREASGRGMKVNGEKTCLVCVTGATSFQAEAQIKDAEGNIIKSSNSAKFLGVTLDSDCSFRTHVDNVQKRIRARSWALNTLRRTDSQRTN